MKLKNVIIFGLACILVLACTGIGAAKAKITIKIANNQASSHPFSISLNEKFVKIVNEKTKGEIEVKVFDDGQLGSHRDVAEGLQLGTIDAGMIAIAGLRVFDEKTTVLYLPYLFDSREHAFELLDGDFGDYLFKLIESRGAKGLGWMESGYRHITNSVGPIYKPEDLRGIKIRVPEIPIQISTFKALETNPTPIAFGELFTALQQGTVDGQENPLPIIYSSHFDEVQKYLSLSGHVWNPEALLISLHTWNKLSDEQKLILQEAAKVTVDYERELCANMQNELIQQLKDKGMEVNEVDIDAFKSATKVVYDEYGSQFSELLNLMDK